MTSAWRSRLCFAAALAVLMTVHFLDTPMVSVSNKTMLLQRQRIIVDYLQLRAANVPTPDALIQELAAKAKENQRQPILLVPIALIFYEEGDVQKARDILHSLEKNKECDLMLFVLGERERPPPDWAASISSDWVGMTLSHYAFTRLNQSAEAAEMLLRLRHLEQKEKTRFHLIMLVYGLATIGMGLLLSMYFSNRYLKLEGKEFFQLKPLYLPFESLFYFMAGYCVISLIVYQLVGPFFEGLPPAVSEFVPGILEMALTMVWVKFVFFQDSRFPIFESLGIGNLQMRWFTVFQIVGGLGIVFALYLLGAEFSSLWPYEGSDPTAEVQQILGNPLTGVLFLLYLCVVRPCFEEVIFRGLIFRVLLGNVKPGVAVLGAGLFFMLFSPLSSWLMVFGIGVACSIVFYRTANLLVAIWIHGALNAFFVFSIYYGMAF